MPELTPVCTFSRVYVEEESVKFYDACCAGGGVIEVEWCHDAVCDAATSGPVAQSPLLKGIVVALLCSKASMVFIVMLFKGLAFGFVLSLLHFDSMFSQGLGPHLCSPHLSPN